MKTKQYIQALAQIKYGDHPTNFAAQREGFEQGYETCQHHCEQDNYGWININTQADLPPLAKYHVIFRETKAYSRQYLANDRDLEAQIETFSHYQPIVKPPSPIR